MKVAQAVLQGLKREGIDHAFLVPGAMIDPFLPAFAPVGIRPIVACHEGGAVYMAQGYGRARQGIGVCMGIGGPGVSNMMTGLAAAYSDRSSVLAVAGTIPPGWEGRGAFQDSSPTGVDDLDLLRPVTAFAERVPSAVQACPYLKKALRAMRGIENRPAFLGIPLDMQQEDCPDSYEPDDDGTPPRVLDASALGPVIDLLMQSTRCAVFAGNGVALSDAGSELEHLVTEYHLPVVTTLRAKGVLSEEHPCSLGVFGIAGSLQANVLALGSPDPSVLQAEVLLLLGVSLDENNTHGWAPGFGAGHMVRVDINPNLVVGQEYRQLRVVADIRTFLQGLAARRDEYDTALRAGIPARDAWLASIRRTPYYENDADRGSDEVPIHPARVIAELRKGAGRDAVLVVDSGAHTFFACHHWTSYGGNEFLVLTTTGPMGYGIAAAIGAKLARPEQPCIAVVGDGSMLMHGMEIATAARYGVPVTVVTMNNGALGNVYLRARHEGPEAQALALIPTHDWAAFARSLGAEGVVVERPEDLASAFRYAMAASGPFLVDVRCSRDAATPNTWER